MAQGRCVGCGLVGSSRAVQRHTMSCERYIDLFRNANEPVLYPGAEYERYRDEELNPEAIAAAKRARIRVLVESQDARIAARESRWDTPEEILADLLAATPEELVSSA